MKKYIIKILVFLAIIFVVDFAYGKVCDYLRCHSKGGLIGHMTYISNNCSEDIIMMGSSRMCHHYIPKIIEDSLGYSCYNAGIEGNGIIFSYGLLQMILERYAPKLIIYDVSRFDIYQDDNTKYLEKLKPYYKRSEVYNIIKEINKWECLKIKSSLYRDNTNLLNLVADYYKPRLSFDKGYWPINKTMDYVPNKPNEEELCFSDVDSLKLEYINKFIFLAQKNKVKLFFCISPSYYGEMNSDYSKIVRRICLIKDVPFVDCSYDSLICSSIDYWADATHMNDRGAHIYTRHLCSFLHNRYYNN